MSFNCENLRSVSRERAVVADRKPHRERGGVVLVAAIVCLSVATALVVVTARQSLDARRQGRHERQLRQTEYLLDAGIRRAIAGLRGDTSYAGETWQPVTALPDFEVVNVAIEISHGPGGSEDRRVTVVALLGKSSSPGFQTQRSHTFLVPPPPTADTESSAAPDATAPDAAETADRTETKTAISTPDPE